jgi:hypothetical protein
MVTASRTFIINVIVQVAGFRMGVSLTIVY